MQRLSKSRFMAGLQCPKYLWWRVHEPDAAELKADPIQQDRFAQGHQVGEVAQVMFPGGVLIRHSHTQVDERLKATREALESGAPAIFEATFVANEVFVAIDILERTDSGHRLIDVKSSTNVKDEHIPDAAVQTWVAETAGVGVESTQIMHLNKKYRHGGQEPLLRTTDVTVKVRAVLPSVPEQVESQLRVLDGPLPERAIGLHCHRPRDCPFLKRCWPADPDHISTLCDSGSSRTAKWMAAGVTRIGDLPPDAHLSDAGRRQLRALREQRLIVEPGLAKALEAFQHPVGFLDFETVSRAIPRWEGLAPWGEVPAQFSYHEIRPGQEPHHSEWLASDASDPRRECAKELLAATAGARSIATYTGYEKRQIQGLIAALPDLAARLRVLLGKLVDLYPVVAKYVYHHEFHGSFSLKAVLTPLVPALSYQGLDVKDGETANVLIASLLFSDHLPLAERARIRDALLKYCEQDTKAMMHLFARLQTLAAATA